MSESQTEFRGWARVEVMGHQSHIGFVTTETYGAAILFRIDQPAIPGAEETLTRPEWVGETYCQPGSVIQRAGIEAISVLVGAGSIYRITPCDEAAALRAIQTAQRRPLMVVKLAEARQITASFDFEGDDTEDEAGPRS